MPNVLPRSRLASRASRLESHSTNDCYSPLVVRRVVGLSVVAVSVVAVLAVWLQQPLDGQEPPRVGWTQAQPGYPFAFPRDHASHPDYRVEWWYYTGNLAASDGREYGYQLTFFRVGIDPAPDNPSAWAVRDLHMAHLAVTDIDGRRHMVAERLNRVGVGWAGAATDTLDVWNEGWRVNLEGTDDGAHLLHAHDETERFGLDLRVVPVKAPVMHGRGGFSQKGAEPGNASQYYSLTRLRTTGSLVVGGQTIEVDGLSWMDHEFSTSFLEPAQQGWDWFSLQLDGDTELMVYVLRRRDGSVDPHSGGTVVNREGSATALGAADYHLEPGRTWTSPTSGAVYPVEWQIEVPTAELILEVRAAIDGQELHTDESTGVTYWEGAVVATGTRHGEPVQGRGYLEMTGYAGPPMSEVLR